MSSFIQFSFVLQVIGCCFWQWCVQVLSRTLISSKSFRKQSGQASVRERQIIVLIKNPNQTLTNCTKTQKTSHKQTPTKQTHTKPQTSKQQKQKTTTKTNQMTPCTDTKPRTNNSLPTWQRSVILNLKPNFTTPYYILQYSLCMQKIQK